jgi:plasmid stabilization system protein ParE
MKPIITSPRAEVQILEIELWWLANREKNPDFFKDELEKALDVIVQLPDAGESYSHDAIPGVRRRLLGTGHHVYYVNESQQISILALWGAPREDGPDLGNEPL